jgi:hypothetical protein
MRCPGVGCAGEFLRLRNEGVPEKSDTFESRLTAAFVDVGWALLAARGLTVLIMRLLLRL